MGPSTARGGKDGIPGGAESGIASRARNYSSLYEADVDEDGGERNPDDQPIMSPRLGGDSSSAASSDDITIGGSRKRVRKPTVLEAIVSSAVAPQQRTKELELQIRLKEKELELFRAQQDARQQDERLRAKRELEEMRLRAQEKQEMLRLQAQQEQQQAFLVQMREMLAHVVAPRVQAPEAPQ